MLIGEMSGEQNLVQCYNRGCGQKYDPCKNSEDACVHHPGEPFFHDAYKGWTCCSKKCTDFTEFLNIKGCAVSKHSNIKPPEPEKKAQDVALEKEVIEVKPIIAPKLQRPPFDAPMIILEPELAASIKQQLNNITAERVISPNQGESTTEIAIGTLCKRGCNTSYQGPETDLTTCHYHSGCPIFHEGMKFWSCCQKRTTDFNAFLNQVGCTQGSHLWIKQESESADIKCRWDYHQTGSHVVVAIYAKEYCPTQSVIKLNPIRLYVSLVFPQQSNACFNLDVELRGVVDIKASQATMFGTKVEIKLKKAEPGSWADLVVHKSAPKKEVKKDNKDVELITPQVDAVDLSDI